MLKKYKFFPNKTEKLLRDIYKMSDPTSRFEEILANICGASWLTNNLKFMLSEQEDDIPALRPA